MARASLVFVSVATVWTLLASVAAEQEAASAPRAEQVAPPAWVQQMLADPDHAKHIAAAAGVDWCQVMESFRRRHPQLAELASSCPTYGSCDDPAVRDLWIPIPSTPIRTVRLKFNVFCRDDGSNPAATQADVDAQVAQLNSDYLDAHIQFVYQTEFINDTTFRTYNDIDEVAMKTMYADQPDQQCNVYVVNIVSGYLGVGTFAWDPDALGAMGGIIVDDDWFGAGQKTLTHELGHNLGLWHTHHGVSEVSACSACYERADGLNGDLTGDFAADTPPTPTNYACGPPGGTDSCSGLSWGPTDPNNYMGYAPDSCYNAFSTAQIARMHCWINAVLTGWLAPDVTPPTVTDENPPAGSTITTTSVNIDVTFSEPVFSVDATDLSLSGTAAAGAVVGTPVDLGAGVWRFPVTGLASGSLDVSLAPDANDIEDAAGNDLDPSPTQWSYTVALTYYTLNLTVNDETRGTVSVEPNEAGGPPYVYIEGTHVTLTAVPEPNRSFKWWRIYDPNYPGDANHAVTDANNPLALTMDSDQEIEAIFNCGSGVGSVLPMMLTVLGLFVVARHRR
jgi:hypothetical protein